MAPGGQVGVDAHLKRREVLLLQARDLRRRERRGGELGERRSAPQLQRLAQLRGRVLRASGRQRVAAVGDLAFEALGVELAGAYAEAVAGRRGDQHVGVVERLAQPRDVDLDGLDRAGRHVLAPQRDREALRAHGLIGVQGEHREHGARSGAAERHRTAVGAHLERTEDPELQHCTATLLARAAGG